MQIAVGKQISQASFLVSLLFFILFSLILGKLVGGRYSYTKQVGIAPWSNQRLSHREQAEQPGRWDNGAACSGNAWNVLQDEGRAKINTEKVKKSEKMKKNEEKSTKKTHVNGSQRSSAHRNSYT